MIWLIPVCFLIPLGIITGDVISLPVNIIFILILLLISLSFLLVILNHLNIAILIIWFISFLIGTISVKHRVDKAGRYPISQLPSDHIALIRVDSFPEFRQNFTSFNGKILEIYRGGKGIFKKARILINLEGKINITYGQCLLSKLNCKESEDYGVPGLPSYKKILSYNEIHYVCNLKASGAITEIANCDYFFVTFLKKIRHFIREFIMDAFPPDVSGFLLAITTGDRSVTSDESIKNFRNSGTAHLLAISGLHVGVVGFFIYFAIKRILTLHHLLLILFNIRRITAILTVPFIFTFCLIAGMSPSTERAFIMSVMILAGLAMMRKPHLLSVTLKTWCLMLIIDPSSLFDLSFQLSFGAIFAIILFHSKFNIRNFKSNSYVISRIIQFIAGNILTTVAGFAGTAVIIAKVFKTIPLFFIPANLIAVPLSSIILPALFLCLLLSWLPLHLNPLIPFISILTEVLFLAINFFGSIKYSTIKITPPDNYQFAIYYLILSLLLFRIRLTIKLPLIFILLILFFVQGLNLSSDKNLKITFIDVGHGDSTFIEFPDGKNMLVDCGKEFMEFNAGERIIAPFLWHKKIKKIDTLIMTHQQKDHTGGCSYIFERFDVDEIWLQDTDWSIENFDKKEAIFLKFKEEVIKNENDITIISMNPGISHRSEDNNNSMVLKIQYRNFSLLLTGDIERKGEDILSKERLKSTVLKVPHHGSCTSSSYEFLRSVHPEIAIISAGRQNLFHHPCKKVVERIENFTRKIFVTAKDGTITVTTDGYRLCYSTFFTKQKNCYNM